MHFVSELYQGLSCQGIEMLITLSDTPSVSRPSALRSNRLAASLVEALGSAALLSKELAERGGGGEMEVVGNLGDAHR